jgi:isocitrate/isopropylmalate dehydrogenase
MYKVNPTAMILSVKLMLDWLGEKKHAGNLEQAITEVIKEGKVRTFDVANGKNSTLEVAEEITWKL